MGVARTDSRIKGNNLSNLLVDVEDCGPKCGSFQNALKEEQCEDDVLRGQVVVVCLRPHHQQEYSL